jgi:hypothetical protein
MKILIADYHVGTQLWQKAILYYLFQNVDVESLSGHGHLIGGMTTNKLIQEIGAIYGGVGGSWDEAKTNIIKQKFSENDIKQTFVHDAVITSFPPGLFTAYTAFRDMKVICNAAHRFHNGHYPIEINKRFIKQLIEMAASDKHIVASMSKYDSEYIRHYTGIEPVPLYVSCFHLDPRNHYRPTSDTILIGPAHAHKISPFESIDDLHNQAARWSLQHKKQKINFAHMKSLYPEYQYADLGKLLGQHKAIIIFPYSVFSISMVEIYESHIPCFVPSIDILIKHKSMYDRVMFPTYCTESDMTKIDTPHFTSPHKLSPNSYDEDAERYWLQFCYFYQQKNTVVWNSLDDLMNKLTTLDLHAINKRMHAENMENRKTQLNNWRKIVSK